MPKVMKTCRVCGRSYEACRTVNNALGVFRWQEVACSPECGSIYLQKLNESRGVHTAEPETKPVAAPVSEPVEQQADAPAAEPVKSQARNKRSKKNNRVVPLRLEPNGNDADATTEKE